MPVASAVVLDGVANDEASGWHLGLRQAGEVLHRLFAATVEFLADG
jgi:hypothetical protein